ncbi:MAG: hypothetical protein Kow00129_10470 [Thermoleophilia bacterium]
MREARSQLSRLLDTVESGEEVVITRRGVPVARLLKASRPNAGKVLFPSRRELRERLPRAQIPADQLIRELRDERG